MRMTEDWTLFQSLQKGFFEVAKEYLIVAMPQDRDRITKLEGSEAMREYVMALPADAEARISVLVALDAIDYAAQACGPRDQVPVRLCPVPDKKFSFSTLAKVARDLRDFSGPIVRELESGMEVAAGRDALPTDYILNGPKI